MTLFIDFLDSVAKRSTEEAFSIYIVALAEAAKKGVPPSELMELDFDAVLSIIGDKRELPGWDMTVWGIGFVGSSQTVGNPA